MQQIPLCYLPVGTKAVISETTGNDDLRRRLQDLGFVKGAIVECVLESPLGDPAAYYVKGSLIALRSEESSLILVE